MFLKLTGANNQKIRINMDLIEAYGTITEKSYYNSDKYIGMTYMVPAGLIKDGQPYIVKETPEQIDHVYDIPGVRISHDVFEVNKCS